MADGVAAARFHEVGCRVMAYAAGTHYRTDSLAQGARLAEAIAEVAEPSGPRTDVDLRWNGVTVRLTVNREGQLTEDDVDIASYISRVARELGADVDLAGLQMIQVAIDAMSIPGVMPFWQAVLGYLEFGDTLVDPKF